MAAVAKPDVHHRAPRCLLGLFDAAAAGLAERSEFEAEIQRWGVEFRGLSRECFAALIEGPTREIPINENRGLHQEASDFARWGRRGPEDLGPLWPAVLLAARPLPLGRDRAGRVSPETPSRPGYDFVPSSRRAVTEKCNSTAPKVHM